MTAGIIGERLLLTLWVGTIWAIGYIAVPAAFVHFDDNVIAGAYAGRLFTLVNYIGIACGSVLLLRYLLSGSGVLKQWRFAVTLGMLLLTLLLQFYFQAEMAAIKTVEWRTDPALSAQFDWLHQMSTAVYLVISVLGLALVATQQSHDKDKANG